MLFSSYTTGEHDTVYKALKQAPDLHVFLKEDIPRDYHYTYNRRIQPIVVSAPEGYNICINKTDCSAALHSSMYTLYIYMYHVYLS